MYFGNTTAVPGSSDYYVGAGAALGKAVYTDEDKDMLITATVPLTVAIQDQGISCDDRSSVVKHLTKELKWVMRKVCFSPTCHISWNTNEKQGPGGSYDLSKLPSLKVGVSSAEVTYGGPDELPEWGTFETYYEITDKKDCGLTKKDSHIVKSDDARDYLGNSR